MTSAYHWTRLSQKIIEGSLLLVFMFLLLLIHSFICEFSFSEFWPKKIAVDGVVDKQSRIRNNKGEKYIFCLANRDE